MKALFRKAAALLAAGALTFSMFSCSSSSSDDHDHDHEGNLAGGELNGDENVELDQMPYGAQLMKLTKAEDGVAIGGEVDTRYLSVEEYSKLADYLYAINTKDATLLSNTMFPGMADYMVSRLGSGTTDNYVASLYDNIKSYTGGDFEFNYIQTLDCQTAGSGMDFSSYDSLITTLAPDAQITSRKCVSCDIMFDNGKSSLSYRAGQNFDIILYTVNGNCYAFR